MRFIILFGLAACDFDLGPMIKSTIRSLNLNQNQNQPITNLLNSVLQSGFLSGLDLAQCSTSELGQLSGLAGNLTSCYRQSMFFSSLSTVCSPQCLSATVSASAIITSACKISLPSVSASLMNSNSNLVYSVWTNQTQANVACSPNSYGTGYCLGDFAQAASQLVLPYNIPNPSPPNASDICTPCNQNMYKTFRSSPNQIPSVYYYTVPDPTRAMSALSATCGW